MNVKTLILLALVTAVAIGGAFYTADVFAIEGNSEHSHGHEESDEAHGSGEEDHHDHAKESNAKDDHGHDHDDEHEEGVINLTAEQMEASGINVVSVRQGSLSHQINVPGRIIANADRMAQIVPKVSGIVIEARKNLGDKITKGEVLALIESREMAESVAEYQAAQRSAELSRTLYNREKNLWQKKITAEQDYLTAKNVWQEAQIRLDLSKQKMETLGGSNEKGTPSRYHELKSPIDGVIVERSLILGAFADTSSQAFTVADLSALWVETSIAPGDLSRVYEGQVAIVESDGKQDKGKIIFVSPVINSDTRSAKAIIELENSDGRWRSGDYSNVSIITKNEEAGISVPIEAIQTIEGKPAVFVRTEQGFEKREVVTGKRDARNVEISSGLKAGEQVAIGNTFVLKAESGKSEAEHAH